MTQPAFVLIHSPLVGLLTWQAVAATLREQGYTVFTPELADNPESTLPFWQQEVASVHIPASEVILVGHSGAGALLPAIGQHVEVGGYLFVDAVLLFQPGTRLDMLRQEDAAFAAEFEQYLQGGGRFPNWQDEQLQALIADDDLRRALLADMRPRSLDFFSERIEVPADWHTRPCGYIQLSETYTPYADTAAARGWPVVRREGHHFEMLTKPDEIARLLVEMRGLMGL